MSSRISLEPKIFPIIFENWPPMVLSVLPRQSLSGLKDATHDSSHLRCAQEGCWIEAQSRVGLWQFLGAHAMPNKRRDSDCVISVLQPKNFVVKQTVKRSVFAGFVLQGNGKWGKARCDAVLTPSGVSRSCPMELASTLISSRLVAVAAHRIEA